MQAKKYLIKWEEQNIFCINLLFMDKEKQFPFSVCCIYFLFLFLCSSFLIKYIFNFEDFFARKCIVIKGFLFFLFHFLCFFCEISRRSNYYWWGLVCSLGMFRRGLIQLLRNLQISFRLFWKLKNIILLINYSFEVIFLYENNFLNNFFWILRWEENIVRKSSLKSYSN